MDPGHITIIVLFITIFFYVTEKLPIPVVAVLSTAALVVFKVIPADAAWSAFSGDVVLLTAGIILIGSTLFETGVAGIVAGKLIQISGGNPKHSLVYILMLSGILSAFLSNTAVTVMFLPLIAGIIVQSEGREYEQKYMQPLTIMTSVGGLLTLIGSPVQLAVSGVMEASGVQPFNFFQFTKISIVMYVICIIYILTVGDKLGNRIWGKNPTHSEFMQKFIEKQDIKKPNESINKKNSKMLISFVIMILTIVGIITTSYHGISMGTIGILGGLACVITGCISIKQMYEKMDWGTLFLLAGSIGFASGLSSSGGGQIIADFFISLFGNHLTPMTVFIVFTLISAILTQIMSNTGTCVMLTPIAISLADALSINPVTIAVGITLAATCSFSTPMASPTQALIINWGGYKFMDYVRYSGPITVILNIAILIFTPLIYPLV